MHEKEKFKKIFYVLLACVTSGILLFDNCKNLSLGKCKQNDKIDFICTVEKLSEDSLRINYKNSKSLIFEKKKTKNDSFNYKVLDAANKKEMCVFKSDKEIDLSKADFCTKDNKQMCAAVWAFVEALNHNGGNVPAALGAIGGSFAGLAGNKDFQAAVVLIAEGESVVAVIACLSTWELLLIGGGIVGLT